MEKMSRSPDELRAEALREWVASLEGVIPIGHIQQRCECKVAGVVRNIRIDPRRGTGSIEATLIDGSGEMIAKWLGRPKMSGIRLGMGLIVQGIAGKDANGDVVVLNPEYELVPRPEHG